MIIYFVLMLKRFYNFTIMILLILSAIIITRSILIFIKIIIFFLTTIIWQISSSIFS